MLTGVPGTRYRPRELPCFSDPGKMASSMLCNHFRRNFEKLCSVSSEHSPRGGRRILIHHDDDLIAPYGTHHRQRQPKVSRTRLDDRSTGAQISAAFGVIH